MKNKKQTDADRVKSLTDAMGDDDSPMKQKKAKNGKSQLNPSQVGVGLQEVEDEDFEEDEAAEPTENEYNKVASEDDPDSDNGMGSMEDELPEEMAVRLKPGLLSKDLRIIIKAGKK